MRSHGVVSGVLVAALCMAVGCQDVDLSSTECATTATGAFKAAGTWKLVMVDGPEEGLQSILRLQQTYNDKLFGFVACDTRMTGKATADGMKLKVSPDEGVLLKFAAAKVEPGVLAGTYEVIVEDMVVASGNCTFTRYQTSGSYSASGQCRDLVVEFDKTDRAWGVAAGESGTVESIMVGFANAHLAYRLQPYRCGGPLAAGTTYDLVNKGEEDPLGQTEMVLEFGIASAVGSTYNTPDAGSLVLDKLDATGCAGTYTLIYSGSGETVVGSFDVPFDCVEGSPFGE